MSKLVYFLIISVLILFIFGLQKMWFFPPNTEGVRVLMYHKISDGKTDYLTVNIEQFESHLKHLQSLDYQYITTQNLIDFYSKKIALPSKPILLTFDDGYLNNLTLAYPILKRHNALATIFIPSHFVGQKTSWDIDAEMTMSLENLKQLDPSVFSLALHSHEHINYQNLSLEDIEKDVLQNLDFFTKNNLPFAPALAYPYGGRPKNVDVLRGMKNVFEKHKIQLAFRIGNRINSFKIKDLYELKRIDIRGTDSFETFKKKVEKGRERLF